MPGSLITTDLLNALAKKESNNNPNAVGDNGKAIGEYQMWPIAFQDVQQFFPKEFGTLTYKQLKTDRALQRRAAEAYLKVGEQKYGITDFDRLISFYNRGPKARQGEIINQSYVDDVKRRLTAGGQMLPTPKSSPLEAGFRHMNRMAQAMGLGPLKADEMAKIMEKVEPPTAITSFGKRQVSGVKLKIPTEPKKKEPLHVGASGVAPALDFGSN